jgi:RHS repeat-associated protein
MTLSVTRQIGAATYEYSPRNSLIGGDAISYAYDGRGIRTITSFVDPGTSITSLTFAPSTMTGGDTTVGTITLSSAAPAGGAVVNLSSSNPGVTSVPASVSVAAGATTATFNIVTTVPASNLTTSIGASFFDSTQSATLTVLTPPQLVSLTISPSSPTAGTTATGTLTLDNPATGSGAVVSLTSSDPSAASVPATVTIPTGSLSTTFNIAIAAVTSDTTATITASFVTTRTATIAIRANAAAVTSLVITPSSIYGGRTATGTVTLSAAAPSGGSVVTLSSSTPSATVPTTTTVASGATSGTFTVTTSSVASSTPGTITASYGGTASANITLLPCSGFAPPTLGTDETVWIEDSLPASAGTDGVPWYWTSTYKVSGTLSVEEPVGTGVHQHYFYNGYPSQYVATGELITTWVLLDPCNPPREIEFNWQAGNNQPAVSGAYWGENLVQFGTDNTRTRRYMGPLPPVGQWTRLDVPSTFVNLNDQTLTGEGFVVYDGRAWFDRTGKASCTAPIAAAPSSFPSTDVVWFDDDLPSGATGTNWSWDTSQKASGTRSSKDTVTMAPPYTQHYFTGATQPMTAGTGDKFFVYAMLDPCATPAEIMVEFNVGSSWYRGYWGSDDMAAPTKTRIGDLPAAGQWVRLEIPASTLGLEGASITGMSFTMPNGRAWFDRAGIAPASSGMLQTLPNPNPSMASSSSSTTTAPPAPPSRRTRMWSWIKRVIFRRDTPPPVAMLIGSPAIAPQDTGATKQRYSLYTPELSLMAETATRTTTNPPIAYEYVWFNGEPLAQIETATGVTHWYFNDHIGAPVLTTSSTGAVDWRVEREPYGNSYVRTGADRHQPLGLPGQEAHESVDRQYNLFRWYRSSYGRYSQVDPLSYGGGGVFLELPNRSGFAWLHATTQTGTFDRTKQEYSYVSARPTAWADPLGLAYWLCEAKLASPTPVAASGSAKPLCAYDVWCAKIIDPGYFLHPMPIYGGMYGLPPVAGCCPHKVCVFDFVGSVWDTGLIASGIKTAVCVP